MLVINSRTILAPSTALAIILLYSRPSNAFLTPLRGCLTSSDAGRTLIAKTVVTYVRRSEVGDEELGGERLESARVELESG